MKKVSLIFIFLVAIATFANAQATRTWVSGVGDDVNPCSRTAPCKTFAGAISKTASPGIINCLDPGGFGAVTITKSIEINCINTLGSILSSGVQGVVINALTTDTIILRGIDINGSGTTLGTNGINIIQAKSVSVEKCAIAKYSGNGIQVTNSSNQISLYVSDSNIRNFGNVGIFLNNTATGTVRLVVDNTIITNGGSVGIDVAGQSDTITVKNSELSKNTNVGFQMQNPTSVADLESTSIAFNGTGVVAGLAGNAIVRLSRCNIFGNTTNGVGGTGTTKCFSNNVVDGNTGTNACTSPNNPQQ
ncbi:MAG: hypothetical protein QOE82_1127 [Thermoanaerobaculia bacterium]|nr:hypothetical protein [Thermoanaerobaculia bacterium]